MNNKKYNHRRLRTALDRMTSPYKTPKAKKQILIASDNCTLLEAIAAFNEREDIEVRSARTDTPDILVFSASIKIIDRKYVGQKVWELFCEYLAEVNDETVEYPLRDEDGEILLEEPLYDSTPLIIIDGEDSNASRKNFSYPKSAKGEVVFIEKTSVDFIIRKVQHLIRNNHHVFCPVRAIKEGELKKLKEGKSVKRIL